MQNYIHCNGSMRYPQTSNDFTMIRVIIKMTQKIINLFSVDLIVYIYYV